MKWFISFLIFWGSGIFGYMFTTDENYITLSIVMTIIIGVGWLFYQIVIDTINN